MDADCGPLRLLVHLPARGAYARFVVLRRAEQGQRSGAMLQSGSRDGLDAAIHDAETAARRLIATLEPLGLTRC